MDVVLALAESRLRSEDAQRTRRSAGGEASGCRGYSAPALPRKWAGGAAAPLPAGVGDGPLRAAGLRSRRVFSSGENYSADQSIRHASGSAILSQSSVL